MQNPYSGERKEVANDALEPLPFRPEDVDADPQRAVRRDPGRHVARVVHRRRTTTAAARPAPSQAVAANKNEKYNAARIEERKRDHALYIAAAPIEAPTVALAVIVENAGWGSDSAAPIARRVFDYLLLGQYPSEEDMAAMREGKAKAPIGTPRHAADVAAAWTDLPSDRGRFGAARAACCHRAETGGGTRSG